MLDDLKKLGIKEVFESVEKNGFEATIATLAFIILVGFCIYLIRKQDKDYKDVLEKTESVAEEFKSKFDKCDEEREVLKDKIDGYETTVTRLLSSSEAQEKLLEHQQEMIKELMDHMMGSDNNKNSDK